VHWLCGDAPNRYYLCPECGAMRGYVYRDGALVGLRFLDAPDGTLPEAVREEALKVLEPSGDEQPEQ
jgi:hypothetical protein